MVDACGSEDEMMQACFMINQIIKTERDKLKKAAKPDGEKLGEQKPETGFLDQYRQVLVMTLHSMSGHLKCKKLR